LSFGPRQYIHDKTRVGIGVVGDWNDIGIDIAGEMKLSEFFTRKIA